MVLQVVYHTINTIFCTMKEKSVLLFCLLASLPNRFYQTNCITNEKQRNISSQWHLTPYSGLYLTLHLVKNGG